MNNDNEFVLVIDEIDNVVWISFQIFGFNKYKQKTVDIKVIISQLVNYLHKHYSVSSYLLTIF
jgi:hypothetical protein